MNSVISSEIFLDKSGESFSSKAVKASSVSERPESGDSVLFCLLKILKSSFVPLNMKRAFTMRFLAAGVP